MTHPPTQPPDKSGNPKNKPVVAFLGAGLMARPMIERLLAAGYTVHLWNRSEEKLAPLLALGGKPLARPVQAAAVADIVLMCLLDAPAVEATIFGEQGLAASGRPARATLLVDHSSIRPDATRAFADRLRALNAMHWVDAPVSGGVAGAAAGTLAIMCGGAAGAVSMAEPVLRHYAANVTWMGDVGAGQTTKLINQVIVGATIATLAEAVVLAQKAGVDPMKLTRALAGGWADSRPLQVFVPRMAQGYDNPIGAASTMLKDLDTALDLARHCDAATPMAALAQQLFRQLSALGLGDADPAELANLYRKPAPG